MSNDELSPQEGNPAPADEPSDTQADDLLSPSAQVKDSDSRSNFKKVQSSRDEWRSEAEKLKEELEAIKRREKEAAEEELRRNEEFQKLAEQKAEEAASERARAEAYEARVKEFEAQQETELQAILESIPEEKRPPLDESDSISKRLQQAKYAQSLLESSTPKPPVGAGVSRGEESDANRKKELLRKGNLSQEEAFELIALGEE